MTSTDKSAFEKKAYRSGTKPMLDWADEKESFIANNKFKDDHPFKHHALTVIQQIALKDSSLLLGPS